MHLGGAERMNVVPIIVSRGAAGNNENEYLYAFACSRTRTHTLYDDVTNHFVCVCVCATAEFRNGLQSLAVVVVVVRAALRGVIVLVGRYDEARARRLR